MLDPPSKLKKRAPASSAITLSAAKSQGLASPSIQISALPAATHIASRQPPKLRTAQNCDIHEISLLPNGWRCMLLKASRQKTAWCGAWMEEIRIGASFL